MFILWFWHCLRLWTNEIFIFVDFFCWKWGTRNILSLINVVICILHFNQFRFSYKSLLNNFLHFKSRFLKLFIALVESLSTYVYVIFSKLGEHPWPFSYHFSLKIKDFNKNIFYPKKLSLFQMTNIDTQTICVFLIQIWLL